MIMELVLLLGIFAFVAGGVFFSEKGPWGVYKEAGPRLAARIEQNLTTGREFKPRGQYQRWETPGNKNVPNGKF